MNILCVGISHHTAAVCLREQISLSGEALRNALRLFTVNRNEFQPISELVILSTCNRFEIYAVDVSSYSHEAGSVPAFEPLLTYLSEVVNTPREELEPYLYCYSGEVAVHHLGRVSAGLDSMVLGEPQILGQVSSAHQAAVEQGSARHVLSALFRAAVHAGKRVRTETTIARHPTHMSAVAIRLAETVLGPLVERTALVTGTGEIGQQSLKALSDYGVRRLTVASRTLERASEVAESYQARPVQMDRLADALDEVDVVLTSSRTESPLIDGDLLSPLLQKRINRPLVLVDLAVPRNVDPSVRGMDGVSLFDMDDIQSFITSSRTSRQNEIPKAEGIVLQETTDFMHWLAVIPVVGELYRRAEVIRQQEVERSLRSLGDVDPRVIEQIEILSQSLVRKLLHEPTSRLRKEDDEVCLENYMKTMIDLFGLPNQGAQSQDKGELQ
jgi:glutamyl-tRNA reductase